MIEYKIIINRISNNDNYALNNDIYVCDSSFKSDRFRNFALAC